MAEVRFDGLVAQLGKGLAPVYLLAGEEPLLIEQALDALRAKAREQGFSEREVFHVDGQFNWQQLNAATHHLSLFSDRRLLELRMPNGKPGKEGSAVLKAMASTLPSDTLLVVICAALDSTQRKSAWAKALAQAGVMSYAWPVPRHELPRWVAQRARALGLALTPDVIELIAERNEGNLLALSQELEKLALLSNGEPLNREQAEAAVADSARYALFDLPEAVMAGDSVRSLRITQRLRAEGEQPVLVLWGIARDLRVLADLQSTLANAGASSDVFARHRVWKNRQTRLQTLARGAPANAWNRLLARAAAADRVIKGAESRRPWDELIELTTRAARLVARVDQRRSRG